MRTTMLLFLAFSMGCSGDDTPTPVPDDSGHTGDTGGFTIERPDWQVQNHEGSIVMRVERDNPQSARTTLEIMGSFAPSMNGVMTGLWCLERGVCVDQLPATESQWVPIQGEFSRVEGDYDWVGDSVSVGGLKAPFYPDYELDYGSYYYGIDQWFPDLAANPLEVVISGEWGDYHGAHMTFPRTLNLTAPDPMRSLEAKGQVEFTWEPGGEGLVYLRVMANEGNRLYVLDDDGSYTLDFDAMGVNRSSNVQVFFGRWSVETVDVESNTLWVAGVHEQPFYTPGCTNFPNAPYGDPPESPQKPVMPFVYAGVDFNGLIDQGKIRDFYVGADPSAYSATVTFVAMDIDFNELCTATFDASTATPVTPWATESGEAVFEGYRLNLNKAVTDCSAIDPAVFGTNSFATLMKNVPWEVGFGELGPIMTDVLSADGVFTDPWADVEPYIFGQSLHFPGEQYGFETGFAFGYGLEDCATVDDSYPMVARPNGAPLTSAMYQSSSLLVLTFVPQ